MSDSQRPHGLQPTRLLCLWDFPGKSTGVGCHCLLRVTVLYYHKLELCQYLSVQVVHDGRDCFLDCRLLHHCFLIQRGATSCSPGATTSPACLQLSLCGEYRGCSIHVLEWIPMAFGKFLYFSGFYSVYTYNWRRAWQPTPVFLPGESHGQRSLAGYSSWGHKESDTTEEIQHAHIYIIKYIDHLNLSGGGRGRGDANQNLGVEGPVV